MAKKKPQAKKAAAKPALKSAKPAAKPAGKKAEAKKSAKPTKPAPKKAIASKSAKPTAKKVEAKKSAKPTKPAPKKAIAAKSAKSAPKKALVTKSAKPAPKKAIAAKSAKPAPKKAEVKKQQIKEKVLSKAELKALEKARILEAKKEKELQKQKEKEAAKAAKEKAKQIAKIGKKGKGIDLEPGMEEGDEQPKIFNEEDDDDFDSDKPQKVKMTFDEVEEIEEVPIRRKKPTADDDIKESLAEEILALSEDHRIEDVFTAIRSMELFRVESDECVVRGCDNPSTSNGYCRYHYIKQWKDIKKKEVILTEGKLAGMIEELVRKYPMKYVESIITDLADDKAFYGILKELDIEADESDLDTFEDDDLLDDDQDIAFETKVTAKPLLDD